MNPVQWKQLVGSIIGNGIVDKDKAVLIILQ